LGKALRQQLSCLDNRQGRDFGLHSRVVLWQRLDVVTLRRRGI
jgi:hypothetical protein